MPTARGRVPLPPLTGHLAMGGPAGAAGTVEVDSVKLSRDGRPWLPVMGEFHFSRYRAADWREELLKMRAGGLDTVATYLFWNQHEECRGVHRFDGDLDVRRFLLLCHELGLAAVARIGPWAHGECRNGGFPDWLAETGCRPRTDDPAYLALVRPYYARIAHELRGLSCQEGGPLVAVQIENELYDQPGHLATLRRLAQEAGLRAPLWTATAWGNAQLPRDVLLPLYGGYPEAFWADASAGWAREMRRHYFFTPIRDDHAIGADLRDATPAGSGPDDARHPFATCELGGGMAIAYHRRPLVPAADVAALALTKLGSGSVWQGYYLYHGCSQRQGLRLPNQESHATGYPNDLPRVTYDFQAPLGEFGQVRPSFAALRAQHLFLREWGGELATLPSALPEERPAGLDDRETLRWAVRSGGERAFVFVNNHQPHEPLPDHHGVRFTVELPGRTVTFPAAPVTVPTGAHFVWPVGLDLGGGVRLDWASAQPVTRLTVDGLPLTVLGATAGITPQLGFPAGTRLRLPEGGLARREETPDGTVVTVTEPGTGALFDVAGPGGRARLLVLAAAQVPLVQRLRAGGADSLVLCAGLLVEDAPGAGQGGGEPGEVRVHTEAAEVELRFLPAPAAPAAFGPATLEPGGADGAFTRFTLRAPAAPGAPRVACLRERARAAPARTGGPAGRASAPTDADFAHAAVHHVTLPPDTFAAEGEALLRVRYTGDAARAYVAGRLVADHFWYGPDWEIGLRAHAEEALVHGVELRVLPLAAGSEVYVDPSARAGLDAARTTARVDRVSLHPLHRLRLRLGHPAPRDGAAHRPPPTGRPAHRSPSAAD
ncbi:beta-galactosidase [Streptomyces hoynatensis]|uniref:Beta-galactosidase n=1 Tax=Streptomyces hoynatensis TaxID=1141874 RepID=A0A3A9YWM4_9ACTN|nr:beta-galactosidase [Streptomyces hoynatensis]RKN40398.1 beta-galactosidase [Streptomyces hoynatensis]